MAEEVTVALSELEYDHQELTEEMKNSLAIEWKYDISSQYSNTGTVVTSFLSESAKYLKLAIVVFIALDRL